MWRGKLKFSLGGLVEWKGTWVGMGPEDSFPTDEDFVGSENAFSQQIDMNGEDRWVCSGTYLLDNGDGHESFSDIAHALYVIRKGDQGVIDLAAPSPPLSAPLYVVAAGKTEFGNFFSKGCITMVNRKPDKEAVKNEEHIQDQVWTLTLARRYLPDKDPRQLLAKTVAWDTSTARIATCLVDACHMCCEVVDCFCGSRCDRAGVMPWDTLPLNMPRPASKKRLRE